MVQYIQHPTHLFSLYMYYGEVQYRTIFITALFPLLFVGLIYLHLVTLYHSPAH